MKTTTLFYTDGDRVVCEVCPRECRLAESRRGFCYVRQNLGGEIVSTTYGKSTGFCIDPIEKKPLNQFYPGTPVLSFGTAGCNLGCRFCQNWTSTKSTQVETYCEAASPEQIAMAAQELGCKSVAYTYNDPIVWLEYARDTARACRERGIKNVAVTAGYITPKARGEFFKYMDAANVDLKAFTDDFYRRLCQVRLEPILDTIRWLVQETDVWVELTNLLVPGENDSPDEIEKMCAWIVETLGPDVPLHFSAFHPDFELNTHSSTSLDTLLMARDIAKKAGIHYTYTGNVHDPSTQATYCPGCGEMLIERSGYTIGSYRLKVDTATSDHASSSDRAVARCQKCDATIAGRYDPAPGDWGSKRQPVHIADFQPPQNSSSPRSAEDDKRGGETMPEKNQAQNQAHNRPTLTAEQELLIYQAAGSRVAATVNPRAYCAPSKLPDELSNISILGSFVSLKRSGQLRSCCGYMAEAIPLGDAVDHAAIRAAKDDPRFPPISVNELEHLDMEVWILWNIEEMTAEGKDRIEAFEIGKHGLIVEQGHARGLLLPSVATEHGFDNEEFLRQTCRKAGLPLEAWTDPKTNVQTFEGHVIQGELASTLKSEEHGSNRETTEMPVELKGPSDADVVRLAQFCHANLVASLVGGTPNPYAAGGYDGSINGILLSVDAPGLEEPLEIGRIAIKPSIPLQTTLFPLVQTAAASLREAGLGRVDPSKIEVGLTVAWDPILHGSNDSPDMAGIDPKERAIIVMGPSGWSWAYDPEASVDELLKQAIESARLPKSSVGQVLSCFVSSTEDHVTSSNVPKPDAARPPAVAGMFYPRSKEEVDQMLDNLFDDIDPTSPEPWPGVMVPHAGWIYSGHLTAETFSCVQIPKTVIILAPKHGPNGANWAVLPSPAWKLPGQEVMSDPELVEKLVNAIDHLEADTGAHRSEHSIEVQLPILSRLAPEARVVGIAIGGGDWDDYVRFAKQLAGLIETLDEPPLLVASSDMNHFANEKTTRRVDRIALDAIETLDPQKLFETVRDNQISMCGVAPTAIVMETLRQLGKLTHTKLVGYETSAKASGDTNRVVGYAGVLFG